MCFHTLRFAYRNVAHVCQDGPVRILFTFWDSVEAPMCKYASNFYFCIDIHHIDLYFIIHCVSTHCDLSTVMEHMCVKMVQFDMCSRFGTLRGRQCVNMFLINIFELIYTILIYILLYIVFPHIAICVPACRTCVSRWSSSKFVHVLGL